MNCLLAAYLIQEAYLEDELIIEHRPEVPLRMCAAQGDFAHPHIPLNPVHGLLRTIPELFKKHSRTGPCSTQQMHGVTRGSTLRLRRRADTGARRGGQVRGWPDLGALCRGESHIQVIEVGAVRRPEMQGAVAIPAVAAQPEKL